MVLDFQKQGPGPKVRSVSVQFGPVSGPHAVLRTGPLSTTFDVAEQWISEDEVDELDEDNPPLDKLYGPDDFSFLNDDMFE